MDVGTATSQTPLAYQSTLHANGQAAALQAMTQAYNASSSAARSSDSDPLAALAGASALSALTVGIHSLSRSIKAADGSAADPVSGAQFAATYGGLDTSSATALLAGMSPATDVGGLQGFGSGLTGGANLAIAAYQAQQDYGQGSLTTEANGRIADSAASSGQATPAPSATPDPVTAAYLQAVAQATQSMANLSLLA